MITSKQIIRAMENAHLSSLQLVRKLNELMGFKQHKVVMACETEVIDLMKNGTGRYEHWEPYLKYILGESDEKPPAIEVSEEHKELLKNLGKRKR